MQTTEHNRRARLYSLTAAGRERLKDQARDWQAQTGAVAAILSARLSDVS